MVLEESKDITHVARPSVVRLGLLGSWVPLQIKTHRVGLAIMNEHLFMRLKLTGLSTRPNFTSHLTYKWSLSYTHRATIVCPKPASIVAG